MSVLWGKKSKSFAIQHAAEYPSELALPFLAFFGNRGRRGAGARFFMGSGVRAGCARAGNCAHPVIPP